MLKLDVKKEHDICIITPDTPRLDASTAVDFKTALLNLIKEEHIRILLNLEHIDFIDSSGLGAIISALRLVGVKGDIKLCCVNEQIIELLRLTRLDKILESFQDEKAALQGF